MTTEEMAKKLGIEPGENMYPQLCGVLLGKLGTFKVFKYDDRSGALFDEMFGEIIS